MTDIHDDVRTAECGRAWREMVKVTREKLRNGWDPAAWACEVSCLATLGECGELQLSLETHSADVERSDVEVRSFSYYIAGRMYKTLGEYDLALAAYMRASGLRASFKTRALSQLQMSNILVFVGEYGDSQATAESVLDEAVLIGDNDCAAHALDFLTDLALRKNDLGRARAHARNGREHAEQAKNLYRLDWMLLLEGQIEWEAGNTIEGISRMRNAQISFADSGARSSELHSCVRLGEHFLRIRQFDDARRFIDRGIELAPFFRHNLSCAAVIRMDAELRHHNGEISDGALTQAVKRAEILKQRALRSLSITHGRTRVYSESDVAEFLATLDPDLFEIVCMRILEHEGYRCTRTPESYPSLDLFAEQAIGARATYRWGVSCKRVKDGVKREHIPGQDSIRASQCSGLMMMTIGKVSSQAQPLFDVLGTAGIKTEIWDGALLRKYLAEHDWILADVGHRSAGFTSKIKRA
jgi:tetratricopeptide (TPR) repeat protein